MEKLTQSWKEIVRRISRSVRTGLVAVNLGLLGMLQSGCQEPAEEPDITTTPVSNIGSGVATSGGNIHSGIGAIAKGVVWSTSHSPTLSLSTKTYDGAGDGLFISNLTGLSAATKYYVRAYSIQASGTIYGQEVAFVTLAPDVPIVRTTTIGLVSHTYARGGGNISDDGGSPITARGIVWNTSPVPTVSLSTKTSDGNGGGEFSSILTGLSPVTTHYARAYATNSLGTGYGQEVTITTLAPDVPGGMLTYSLKDISSSSATGGGEIWGDGGSAVTARGVVWSISPSPAISLSTKTADGTGTGTFTGNLTGLSAATKYYVRAYATNSSGTGYGQELTFVTPSANMLTVTTNSISIDKIAIGPFPWDPNVVYVTLVTGGGYIPDDGGNIVIKRGLEWSDDPAMISISKTDDGTGAGEFETNLTPLLSPGKTYYVRAYATNSSGTAYGQTRSVYVPD